MIKLKLWTGLLLMTLAVACTHTPGNIERIGFNRSLGTVVYCQQYFQSFWVHPIEYTRMFSMDTAAGTPKGIDRGQLCFDGLESNPTHGLLLYDKGDDHLVLYDLEANQIRKTMNYVSPWPIGFKWNTSGKAFFVSTGRGIRRYDVNGIPQGFVVKDLKQADHRVDHNYLLAASDTHVAYHNNQDGLVFRSLSDNGVTVVRPKGENTFWKAVISDNAVYYVYLHAKSEHYELVHYDFNRKTSRRIHTSKHLYPDLSAANAGDLIFSTTDAQGKATVYHYDQSRQTISRIIAPNEFDFHWHHSHGDVWAKQKGGYDPVFKKFLVD